MKHTFQEDTCKRMSVKAFVCFHLRNLRSNPLPCVVKNNVHIDIAGTMTRSKHSFCAFIKEMDCHSGICVLYILLLGNLWMIYDSLKNRIENGNASRYFLILCKADLSRLLNNTKSCRDIVRC